MTKNKRKALRLLQAGLEISEERFPTNYERAMEAHANGKPINSMRDLLNELVPEPTTEAEFHNEHSVEKDSK